MKDTLIIPLKSIVADGDKLTGHNLKANIDKSTSKLQAISMVQKNVNIPLKS